MYILKPSALIRSQKIIGGSNHSQSLKVDTSKLTFKKQLVSLAIYSLSILIVVLYNQPLIVVIPVIYHLTQYFIRIIKIRNRNLLFERDYPIFLVSLSSSIKCGIDPLGAIILSKELFEAHTPIAIEIEKFHQLISKGVSEQSAIKSFGDGISSSELVLFKDAFILSRQQGASLSSCLHRIAKVVRARQSFRRKSRAAVAMQKLSAFGILFAVIVVFSIQISTAQEALINAWEDPIGMKLLLLALVLTLLGLFGMLRVGSLEAGKE